MEIEQVAVTSCKTEQLTSNKKKGAMSNKRAERIFLFLMLSLPVLQWLIFWLYVHLDSFLLAFQDKRTGELTFQNFEKFWEMLTSPKGEIKIALKNTLIYFSTEIIILLPVSLLLSYFLYKKIFMYKVFRVIFYLPAIVSSMVMVETYTSFISPNGPIAKLIGLFGGAIPPQGLLANSNTATTTIVVYCIWTGFCGNVLLFGSAMARVPMEILESARLEGCGPFRELVQLILPLIWPTMSTQIIFTCTGIFNSSGPILLFTNGAYETETLSFWIFAQIYGGGKYGGSGNYNIVSATGLCFTLVGAPLILFIRWLFDKIPTVEY